MRRISNGEFGFEFAKAFAAGLDFDQLEELYRKAACLDHWDEPLRQHIDQECIEFIRSLGCEKRIRTPRELANLLSGIRNGIYLERRRRDKVLLSLLREIAREQGWEHKE